MDLLSPPWRGGPQGRGGFLMRPSVKPTPPLRGTKRKRILQQPNKGGTRFLFPSREGMGKGGGAAPIQGKERLRPRSGTLSPGGGLPPWECGLPARKRKNGGQDARAPRRRQYTGAQDGRAPRQRAGGSRLNAHYTAREGIGKAPVCSSTQERGGSLTRPFTEFSAVLHTRRDCLSKTKLQSKWDLCLILF